MIRLALALLAAAATSRAAVLSPAQIETFKRDGVLVVPGILSAADLRAAREGLHRTLRRAGVDPASWEGADAQQALRSLQLTGGKGGIVDIYYNEWVMRLRTHPRMFAAISELWAATWAAQPAAGPLYRAPASMVPATGLNASQGFAYLDRAVWRLPVPGAGAPNSLQPGLLPHFDACPLDLFGERGLVDAPTRWRPIQSSLALSPIQASAESGGFVAAPGFHREFATYFGKWDRVSGNGGDGTVHCSGQFSVLRDGVRLVRSPPTSSMLSLTQTLNCTTASLTLAVVLWFDRARQGRARTLSC